MKKLFGTMENAGGWRFLGPTHATAKLAQDFLDQRVAAGWYFESKVVTIWRKE